MCGSISFACQLLCSFTAVVLLFVSVSVWRCDDPFFVSSSMVWYGMVWGTIPGVRCGVTLDFYSRKRTPCASPVMSSSTTTVLLWGKANRSCFYDHTQKELQVLGCTEPGVATLALVLI